MKWKKKKKNLADWKLEWNWKAVGFRESLNVIGFLEFLFFSFGGFWIYELECGSLSPVRTRPVWWRLFPLKIGYKHSPYVENWAFG